MGWLVLAGVVLSALCVLTSERAQLWLAKRGHPKLAAQVAHAHEALHILAVAADDLSHGRPPIDVALEAGKSPEAHAILEATLKKVRGS